MDFYTTEGVVESGIVDFVWDEGWRSPTSEVLRRAQHSCPKYEDVGAILPSRAVVVCFVTQLPSMLINLPRNGKYIVIVGPGDPSLNERGGPGCNVSGWPVSVQHVFGHSVVEASSRMTPIPMAFHAFKGFVDQLSEGFSVPRAPDNRVLVSYSLDVGGVTAQSGHERMRAIRYFRDKSWATVNPSLLNVQPGIATNPWPWREYVERLRQHDFLVVPIGYGVERIAQWEAMVLGTIPICIRHPELLHFSDMPIAFVNNWEEVTPEWCDANMGLIERKSMEKLKLSYWVERIREKAKELRCC